MIIEGYIPLVGGFEVLGLGLRGFRIWNFVLDSGMARAQISIEPLCDLGEGSESNEKLKEATVQRPCP